MQTLRSRRSLPRPLRRAAFSVLLAVASALPAAGEPLEIRRLPDGPALDGVAGLAEAARGHDLVVIGEVHDNPVHQRLQADLARALDLRALALEMVPRDVEPALAELRDVQAGGGEPSEAQRAAARVEDYAAWLPVLDAVPSAHAAGGGLPREALVKAMQAGAATAFSGDAAAYGLDAPLPEATQADLEADLSAGHCGALPAEMLAPMAQAQRLRDAAFAEALLRARAAAGGAQAMLTTGDGHARRDRGVPAYLAHAAPELSVLAIGVLERGEDGSPPPPSAWTGLDGKPIYDILVLTDPAPREDPCAAFLKSREGSNG